MKNVMISQPMNGKSLEEIIEERKDIIKVLKKEGYNVMDTIIKNTGNKLEDIHYLLASLEFLINADYIFFMQGWEKSRGCKIEHLVAVEYGKKIMYENKIENYNNL